MKKILVIILSLIIIISFSFIFLKTQADGPENNFFNRELRVKFANFLLLRQILYLHNDGDGKTDYLGKHYDKIFIEVDTMKSESINIDVLNQLAQKIQAVTSKPVSYFVSDTAIPYKNSLNASEIDTLVNRYRNYKSAGDTATLYLLYLSQQENEPKTLGLTYQEYGLILFENALIEFTKNNPLTLPNYELSTALHEFGHQLGLPHNSEPGCLMNEHAEKNQVARERPQDVIINFCGLEEQQIKEYNLNQ